MLAHLHTTHIHTHAHTHTHTHYCPYTVSFHVPIPESTKDKSSTDKSFTRGWSRSDGQMANTLRSSTNSAPTPETTPAFERGKYKSDGESLARF